jgi:hypothetical protein
LECTAGPSRNPVCAPTKMDESLPPGQAFFAESNLAWHRTLTREKPNWETPGSGTTDPRVFPVEPKASRPPFLYVNQGPVTPYFFVFEPRPNPFKTPRCRHNDLPGERRTARARPQMAGHESPRTTKLYDRTKDGCSSMLVRLTCRPDRSTVATRFPFDRRARHALPDECRDRVPGRRLE